MHSSDDPQEVQHVKFDEVSERGPFLEDHLELHDLRNVRLSITADLGQCTMLVRDILELKRGSVVALDKLAGEMTDIYANGIPLAKGEVVVIADSLHVRISDITGAGGKDEAADEE
jgi:flagellar motor switch protein FliN/FliY